MNDKKALACILMDDIEKCRRDLNEKTSFTLDGVDNLSMSDLDTLDIYAESYINKGSYSGLMKPLGDIRKVLEYYGLLEVNKK